MSRLRVVDELGAELERAIERDRARLPLRRLARAHSAAIALAATLAVAGGAGAAGGLITRGAPVETAGDGQAPVRARTATVEPLRAADPASEIPWGIRVASAADGATCHAAGRVVGGRLGVLRGDVFRELPASHADACARVEPGSVAASWSQYPGPNVSRHGARTVVHGLAGHGVAEVLVRGPGADRRLTLSPRGAFITVYPGLLDAADLPVEPVR